MRPSLYEASVDSVGLFIEMFGAFRERVGERSPQVRWVVCPELSLSLRVFGFREGERERVRVRVPI